MHQHHHHHHGHVHVSAGGIGTAFFLNLGFTIIELVGGFFTNSIAIISDAVHDFGDCLSLALAWYFQKLSRKGSSSKYSYGYSRFSLLGAIVNAVVLTAGSVYILLEAIPRFVDPQPTNAAGMLVLAVLGIVINGIAVLRTRRAVSINERMVSLHLLEDVLGWAAVLVAAVVMYFTGLTIIDPILSAAIAVFVLFNVVKNIRQVLPIILQCAPSAVEQKCIVDALKKIVPIQDVHDLHIWSLDERYNVLTAHVVLRQPLPMDELSILKSTIRAALELHDIQHATIEFELPAENCGLEKCVKK